MFNNVHFENFLETLKLSQFKKKREKIDNNKNLNA
jgi:hypothetical protein